MQLEKTAKVDASIYAYKLGAIAAQQGRLRTQANLQRLDGPLPRYDKPLRSLITLLIQRERIVEAEYLMNELWQEEHFRYIRRSARPGAWNGARRSSNLPGRPLTDVEDFFVPTEQALLTRTLELETISTRVSAAIKQAAGLAPTWSAFARMDNQSNSSLDVERADAADQRANNRPVAHIGLGDKARLRAHRMHRGDVQRAASQHPPGAGRAKPPDYLFGGCQIHLGAGLHFPGCRRPQVTGEQHGDKQ